MDTKMKNKNRLFIFASILVILVMTSFVAAHEGVDDSAHHCGMGTMMYGSYGFGPMLFGWAIGLLVLVALVLLIVWLIKQIQKK
ncbi:hypothetical protein GOV14_01585 [Candidatus Pacearchaeota archaeon]|nr:hypothetical protein [Candidatus Pacearchaeota archaeon]